MILSCQNISKAFHEKCILKNVSFHIEDYDKAAIVGINGAGKTTLLKMITGDLEADEGTVALSREKSLGYLAQHQSLDSTNTIYDELLSVKQGLIQLESRIRETELKMKSASPTELEKLMESYSLLTHQFESGGGYSYRSELTGVLKGLGFAEQDFSKPISTLSGGQKTRVALGRLLLLKPDLIILDEPTNHLDMSSITWLETYLLNYKGAVIIVSHDRYFLDRTVNKVIEIDQTRATVFQGSYSDYAHKKEILRAAQLKAYMNQQQEIRHQEAVIARLKSFNREKSVRRAESREKMLKKTELLEKPAESHSDMHITLAPKCISGNDVLYTENLSKSFDALHLFSHIGFRLQRGEHVALIGDNGTGKTTILKMINGLLEPDEGTIRIGSNVHIGYYDQEHHVLHMEKTLFEEISDDYPSLSNTEIRSTLAAFLFTGEDVFKRIGDLSGGERGRVSLAKLMLSEANLLILDEPTNHLDILSKEILEDALNHYTGTVLYVSHDRYFINRTASRILELSGKGLTSYLGSYDYYMEKKQELAQTAAETPESNAAAPPEKESASKLDWKEQKELQARLRKRENELKRIEDRIEHLENRDAELDTLMSQPDVCTNVARLQELSLEKETISEELTELMERWEALGAEE
ncbi:MAG: ABC-F type ribosomal protection protein [Lachnospiraceae bacterium]|nr:ABC-F type ribosomal protection protein [Lachnospiraceae bacterium]